MRERQFDDRDIASTSHVVVLSERTALELFGTLDAIGRSVTRWKSPRFPGVTCAVIGVARQTDSVNS